MKSEDRARTIAFNQIHFLQTQMNKVLAYKPIYGDANWLSLGDISNLFKYYSLVINRKYTKASRFGYSLDTACRDLIKESVFQFVINKEDEENGNK